MSKTQEAKSSSKKSSKFISVRISSETQKKAEKILLSANKKAFGRKVKIDQVLNLALDFIAEEQIQLLQKQALTNEDRLEMLRKIYSEKCGPASRESFTGFMLTSDFQNFLAEHSEAIKLAV